MGLYTVEREDSFTVHSNPELLRHEVKLGVYKGKVRIDEGKLWHYVHDCTKTCTALYSVKYILPYNNLLDVRGIKFCVGYYCGKME